MMNNTKNTTRESNEMAINFTSFPKGFDESQLSLYQSLLLKQCTKCNHRNGHASSYTNKQPEAPLRSEIQNDCIKTIPRVNPLSSGVSLRSLPKATSEDIIKVCNFYIEKCKGKYSEKTRAYRMMTEMASEIIRLTEIIQKDFSVFAPGIPKIHMVKYFEFFSFFNFAYDFFCKALHKIARFFKRYRRIIFSARYP